ncbi:hypothetical protein AWP48_16660 [Escherichia coli]|nr:hypothetical protein AWP48_16660 [Escherichia coli]
MTNAKLPDALRLSGLVLSLQCRENRPVFSALYYPSSAEKIGHFSLPAARMPYRALGSNLLRRFMQRTAFLPK